MAVSILAISEWMALEAPEGKIVDSPVGGEQDTPWQAPPRGQLCARNASFR